MDGTLADGIAQTDPPPAPGAARYPSLDFADTTGALPAGQSYDLLTTPESAMRWLAARDLITPDGRLDEVAAQRMRTLRGHIRSLFAACVDGTAPPKDSLGAVNEALTAAPTTPPLIWDGAQWLRHARAHPTVDHTLAALAADAADLLIGPDADLLAVCGSAPCTRFLLRTHGRRHWCCTRCGDRARAARAYARRGGITH